MNKNTTTGTGSNKGKGAGNKPQAEQSEASKLQEQILSQGQTVSADAANILEGEYNHVDAEKDKLTSELVIEPLEPKDFGSITQPQTPVADAVDAAIKAVEQNVEAVVDTAAEQLQAAADVVEPIVEAVVEQAQATQEKTMENVNKEAVNEAVIAAQPVPGMFRRSLNWVGNNKGKLALGAVALVGAGVGIYYLTRGGKADKAASVVATVAAAATEATTEAVA